MTHEFGSYSDWRAMAPIEGCPQCGATKLRSRDCPAGLEVEYASGCGHREVLADFAGEGFDRWMQCMRTQRGS